MVAEPTTATYSDATLTAYIEKYKLIDERGEEPYTWDSATPPAQVVNTAWVETYDLHAAAADVWNEKAAAIASQYDFNAAGSSFSMSKQVEQYEKQARYHTSRRAAKTMTAVKWPEETAGDTFPWIENLAEPDE